MAVPKSMLVWARRCALAVGLACSVTTVSCATVHTLNSAAGSEIIAHEKLRVNAYRRGDLPSLEPLISDDHVATSAYGEVRQRDDMVRYWRDEYLPSNQSNDDVTVRLYGDTAVVTGRTIVRSSGGAPKNNHSRFLRVWVRQRHGWQNAVFHGTFVLNRLPDTRQPTRIVNNGSTALTGRDGSDAEVWDVERDRLGALRANDVATLERLLAPEYLFVDVFGAEHHRDQILTRLAARGRGSDLEDDDVAVRLYGTTAVVTGRTISRVEDPPGAEVHTRFTRVWIRTESGWKLLVYQATHELAHVPRARAEERDDPSD